MKYILSDLKVFSNIKLKELKLKIQKCLIFFKMTNQNLKLTLTQNIQWPDSLANLNWASKFQ